MPEAAVKRERRKQLCSPPPLCANGNVDHSCRRSTAHAEDTSVGGILPTLQLACQSQFIILLYCQSVSSLHLPIRFRVHFLCITRTRSQSLHYHYQHQHHHHHHPSYKKQPKALELLDPQRHLKLLIALTPLKCVQGWSPEQK